MALLEIDSVSKVFGGIRAIDSIGFSVDVGEAIGLVGPNGAGKTTLFNCVCGQLRPDGGKITFDDKPLIGEPTYQRARLGIGRTYQRIEVFPDLTVYEHLMVAERARNGSGRLWKDLMGRAKPSPEECEMVEEILELVGLTDLAQLPVSSLGLGSCRLVELARALVGQPKILLADEPSSGLDVKETEHLGKVLRTVQKDKNMAVLLVEHDLQMVAEVVDRTVVMDLGSKIAEGTFDEVMADPRVRRAYLGADA